MKRVLLTLAVSLVVLAGCQNGDCGYSKSRFLKKYDALVGKVSKADRKISDSAWERDDKVFEQLAMDCYGQYETEMSLSEKRDFWMNALSYLYYRYGIALIRELADPETQKEIIRFVRENAMAVLDGTEEMIEIIKKEFSNNSDWNKLFEDIQHKTDKIMEAIEE